MNHSIVNAIVRSKDGVDFIVATTRSAVPFESAFALKFTAAELERHGDFVRFEQTDMIEPTALETPTQRRAQFRVIKGGKS